MDIQTLQATVREFAAVRHWPRFHTPKNLAMALVVEAAELVEIFQWLTPEESARAASEAAKKQHIGEEIADVLIYLLQLADHTRVDLASAVIDKLRRNARKYPVPTGASDVSLPAMASGAEPVTHVLLDYENVQPSADEVRALVPRASKLWVFHGPHQRQVAERFESFGHDLAIVPISKAGKNALDFHLSFYMGYIAARHPKASFVVLANDKGYEPMLEHARQLDFDVQSIGLARRRRAAATPTSARQAVPKPAVKKAAKPAATKVTAKTATQGVPGTGAKQGLKQATQAATPTAAKAVARPAAKVPARKAAPAAKRASPKPAATARRQGTPVASPREKGPSLQKLEQDLRALGAKRPVRLARLRGVLKSLLGADASPDAIDAALSHLQASGVVAVDGGGQVSYPGS